MRTEYQKEYQMKPQNSSWKKQQNGEWNSDQKSCLNGEWNSDSKSCLTESYTGFNIWLLCVVLLILACSLWPDKIIQKNQVQTVGMIILIMIDFLYLLILASQSIYWTGQVQYKEAAQADAGARRWYAMRLFLCFAAGTIVYLMYCCVPGSPSGVPATDAVAAASCICIPAVITMRIKL